MKVLNTLVINVTIKPHATTTGNLRKHFRHTHEDVTYPCCQCDYKAAHKGTLLSHIRSIHEGVIATYPCSQCDFKATKKSNLQRHERSKHNGVE